MTETYLASLLLMGGVCLGFAVHAASLAARVRRAHYVDLLAVAALQAAYCVVTYLYFRQTVSAQALPYGQWICVFTPFLTFFFGQLVIHLRGGPAPWLRRYQAINLLLSTGFAALAFSDWALGTTLALTGEVATDLASRHRHRLFFTPLGETYLAWVSVAFALFSVVLFRQYRARPDLRPVMLGCLVYFGATTADFGILTGLHDFYFLQHIGFFLLVASCWYAVAGRYDRTVEDLRRVVGDLETQRRELLRSPWLVQQQKLNALGTLAAGIAHEVNNPMQGILGCAELLGDSVEPDSQSSMFAARIVKESQRVADIVQGLLRFARKDDGIAEPVHVAQLIEDTRLLIDKSLAAEGIRLEIRLDPALPEVFGRPQPLRQVLMNLLANALDSVKAAPEDGHPREIRIRAYRATDSDEVVIEVHDSGPGIDPSLSDRIFDPFFTTKKVGEGTGLGLSISHGILAAHGGTLSFESTPGVDTCFRMALPVAPVERAQPAAPSSVQTQASLTPPPAL